MIAPDARPMTASERARLYRLLWGPRPEQPQK